MDGGDQDLFCAPNQIVFFDNTLCIFPIGHVGDDKFHLVHIGPQAFEVVPVVPLGFARSRAFYIENDLGAWIDVRGRDETTRFDLYFVTTLTKLSNKWEYALLCKRFTARDLDQITAKFVEFDKNILKTCLFAA